MIPPSWRVLVGVYAFGTWLLAAVLGVIAAAQMGGPTFAFFAGLAFAGLALLLLLSFHNPSE